MAYLPSNAKIGPNSLQAPSACEAAESDARILEAQGQAALGRLSVFLTTPPSSSFHSPTLAVDAKRILNQSELGRSSILSAHSPVPNQHAERVDLNQLIREAPEVIPLNGVLAGCEGSSMRQRVVERPAVPQMIMPDPAPVSVVVAPNTPPVYVQAQFAPMYLDEPAYSGPAITAGPGAQSQWERVTFGPGIASQPTWSDSGAGLRFDSGPTQYYGYSGYAPPWGDASLVEVADIGEGSTGSWFKTLLLVGGLAILGSAYAGKRGARKRAAGRARRK